MTKNHKKTLAFTTSEISQRKKLMIGIIFTVLILGIYLFIHHASGYIEEKGVIKYLVFDSTDENKGLLKKYNDVWNGIKNKIKEVSDSECDYEKDYMKIKFNSDNNLPLEKPLKFRLLTITIRSGFEEGGKFYPQLFLHDTLY